MQNKILESLMKMEENAVSPIEVVEDKVNIYSSLYESLVNSVNKVKTNNCRSNLDITGLYEKALQEGIQNVYPNNHWTDITKCNIRQTLLENKNDVKATINRIITESIDNTFCDEYIDTEGMFTGKAGGHIHIDELKTIYDEDKDWDPVIGQSASFEDWMNGTIESGYLVAITEDDDDYEMEESFEESYDDFGYERRLLGRLKSDCDYVLGACKDNGCSFDSVQKHFWAGNAGNQILKMRELYALLPDELKPKNLNKEKIDEYEAKFAEWGKNNESLKEDTVKQGNYWVNKGGEGTHGKFKTKKAADAQRKAMFASGYKAEGLVENDLRTEVQEEVFDYLSDRVGRGDNIDDITHDEVVDHIIDEFSDYLDYDNFEEVEEIIKDTEAKFKSDYEEYDDFTNELIKEDIVKKSDGKWVNRSNKGVEHGEFRTKKAADEQRRAMFANMDDEETQEVAYHKEFTKDGKKVSVELWKDGDEFSIEVNKKYGDKIPSDLKKEVKDSVGKKTFDTEKEGKIAVNKAVDSAREKTESCNKKELKEEDDEAALQALRSGATLRDALAESHIDISEKEGTIANILKNSMSEWGNAKTRDEAVTAINNAFKDVSMTPSTKRFLYEISKKRTLNDVITTATNYYLSGANLSMRRGTAAYSRGENYADWREKSSK